MTEQPRTIDVTPTWVGILPVLLGLFEKGDKSARDYAIGELEKVCGAVDALNKEGAKND